MSTALALASVTAVLRNLLIDGLIDEDLTPSLGDVTVSAIPPDRVRPPDSENSQLNLFLYRVTPNLGWSNVGYPTFSNSGHRVGNPPLALDLHYLLSAYGSEDFHTDILLGYGLQLLHEHPVLDRDAIRTALTPDAPSGGGLPQELRLLSTSNLADQVEQIKIVPEAMDSEEISRLWAALQTNYRPTAAYMASIVLIERHRSARPALPVTRRNIMARQLRRPVIETVEPQFVQAGGTLTIRGSGLRAVPIEVRFGDQIVTPTDVTDASMQATLPAGLLAGIRTVQVLHDLDFDTPNEPHRGFQSNVAAFMLRPDPTPGAFSSVVDLGSGLRSAEIDVTFSPEVGKEQQVLLLLNEVGGQDRAYSFLAAPRNGPSDPATQPTITFEIPSMAAGTYLLRVQVDSAESELQVDGTGAFIGPPVTLP
jgi:hypothetical protein